MNGFPLRDSLSAGCLLVASYVVICVSWLDCQLRLRNGSIINTSQWAHDIFQAQGMIQQRYPGSVVLQVIDE
jgi:hypothetical protein